MEEMREEVVGPAEAEVFNARALGVEETLDPAARRIIDEYVGEHPGGQERLIPLLHRVQQHLGYLPFPAQEYVAGKLGMSPVEVYGVVSFYHFFRTKKTGHFCVKVCMGTACFVRGSKGILDKFSAELDIGVGETSPDQFFSLEEVRCIGACGLAPVVVINEDVYGGVEPKGVRKIVRKHRKAAKEWAASKGDLSEPGGEGR